VLEDKIQNRIEHVGHCIFLVIRGLAKLTSELAEFIPVVVAQNILLFAANPAIFPPRLWNMGKQGRRSRPRRWRSGRQRSDGTASLAPAGP